MYGPKFKKVFNLLNEDRPHLKDKWWHRMFQIIYIVFLSIFFIFTLLIFSNLSIISPTSWNSDYTSLKNFIDKNGNISGNSIPSFLNLSGETGCLDNGNIKFEYSENIKESYCQSNLTSHLDEAAAYFHNEFYPNENIQIIKDKLMSLNKPSSGDGSYCYLTNKANCNQIGSIVKYNHNVIFYLQVLFWSFIATFILSFILQLAYFKGLIFIIFGNNKK